MEFETPVNIELKNGSKEVVSFRFFRVNMVQTLQPNETIKLTISNSDELAYFNSLQDEKGIIVIPENETTPPEEDLPTEPEEPTEPTEPEEPTEPGE